MAYIWNIVSVEAAIFRGDKWLIIKRSDKEEHAPGILTLLSGKVKELNPNSHSTENILERNLRREIYEEVGIEIYDDVKYIGSKSFVINSNDTVVDTIFLCRYKRGVARCKSKEEVSAVYWMTLPEIIENEQIPDYVKKNLCKANKIKNRL
ncbi:NUDIX hydrolase [Sporohalobacter salinus]|uniref:NUDIX hydrolase n=1 Tax=Sporohalobacter salinus TaxID=1494606 RepID=UPI001960C503|nr:NUDIX domain-containing protein [Sporohalobacter salinus]MBM7624463.1 NADH pyrophosphatase NudC (nudix superfamily) [Sporohalobacter salinus]